MGKHGRRVRFRARLANQRLSENDHLPHHRLGLIGYAEAYPLQKAHRSRAQSRRYRRRAIALRASSRNHARSNGKREHLLAVKMSCARKGVEFHETSRAGRYLSRTGPNCRLPDPQSRSYPARRGLVCAYAGRSNDPSFSRFRRQRHSRSRQDRNWASECNGRGPSRALCRLANRETWRNRRTHQPLGHLARFCIQCLHRFALFFDLIVPCGIADRKATSLEKLLSRKVDSPEAAARLKKHFAEIFGREIQAATLADLLEILRKAELLANAAPPVAQPILAVQEPIGT